MGGYGKMRSEQTLPKKNLSRLQKSDSINVHVKIFSIWISRNRSPRRPDTIPEICDLFCFFLHDRRLAGVCVVVPPVPIPQREISRVRNLSSRPKFIAIRHYRTRRDKTTHILAKTCDQFTVPMPS